jgi:undecaprenyl-diphosphatase
LASGVARAAALGALHGPAELLPISSSGHIALIPWLLGWDDEHGDEELRKSLQVALHAGTAAALLIIVRDEVSDALSERGLQRMLALALAALPPAIVGYLLERPIERHLDGPATIAAGLAGGALLMAYADRSPQTRRADEAGAADGLWLGVAQASALIPGVSRSGATLAAARWRRFARADATRLSRYVGVPVIAGATVLKGVRLRHRRLPARTWLPLAVAAAAAFGSTLGCRWLIERVERDRSPWPYAIYRLALATGVSVRLARR